MKFDVYSRFVVQVERVDGRWRLWRIGPSGLRRRVDDLAIPSNCRPQEIPVYLDDMYHEFSMPGSEIKMIDDGAERR